MCRGGKPIGHDKDTSRDMGVMMVNVDARNAELADDSGRIMRLCTVEPLITHTPSVDGPMVCVMGGYESSLGVNLGSVAARTYAL